MPRSRSPEYQRAYYARNKEKFRQRYLNNREARLEDARARRVMYRRRLRKTVLEAYGNHCACCGEDNPGFLSVDHVNNDGAEHRKAVNGGSQVLRDIIKRGFPDNYRLLCYNCNLGRQFNGGECPHKIGYLLFAELKHRRPGMQVARPACPCSGLVSVRRKDLHNGVAVRIGRGAHGSDR